MKSDKQVIMVSVVKTPKKIPTSLECGKLIVQYCKKKGFASSEKIQMIVPKIKRAYM